MYESKVAIPTTPAPQLLSWIGNPFGSFGRRASQLIETLLDDRREQVVDVRKMEIDRRGGDADLSRDTAKGERGILGFDHLHSRGEEGRSQAVPLSPTICRTARRRAPFSGLQTHPITLVALRTPSVGSSSGWRASPRPNRTTTTATTIHSNATYAAYQSAS